MKESLINQAYSIFGIRESEPNKNINNCNEFLKQFIQCMNNNNDYVYCSELHEKFTQCAKKNK